MVNVGKYTSPMDPIWGMFRITLFGWPRYISADPSALPEGEAQGKREALTALPACQLGPVRAPPHLGRYVNPTNACQSFQPHPSAFAFSGFEGAKRHRLCRPSGNPLGLNPAGVLLFRMRAHRRGWRLWRAFGVAGAPRCCYVNPTNACQSFQPHPSTFAFSGFEGAKRHRLCQPSGNPLGLNPAGVLLFRMRAHRRGWRLWRAFGVAGAPRCCPGPLRQPN